MSKFLTRLLKMAVRWGLWFGWGGGVRGLVGVVGLLLGFWVVLWGGVLGGVTGVLKGSLFFQRSK